jgi:hypothetical protein
MTNFCHSRENGDTPVKCGTSFFRFFTSFRMTICLFCHSRENGDLIVKATSQSPLLSSYIHRRCCRFFLDCFVPIYRDSQ